MKLLEHVATVRAAADAARAEDRRVALVPTMGYFHAGHVSLMEAARAENDLVVVSVFVNPTQFGPNEDLASYPRDPERDEVLARAAGVDIVFRPSVDEMYPSGSVTTVHVAELTAGLCGAARPTHFDGVTTIVAKLFSIVGASRAYFGRKDYQQLAVVRRMARDLDLPVTVVGCPIVREPDGLAMSSRNAYLTPDQRAAAPTLHAALVSGVDAVRGGSRDPAVVAAVVRAAVGDPIALEYAEVRDAESLASPATISGRCVLALAARLGRARLIDNVVFEVRGDKVEADLGTRVADGPATGTNP